MKKLLPLLAILASSPALAQSAAGGTPAAVTDPGVKAARNIWSQVHAYVVRSAEQMPEEKYGYKPTPAVRSFGELVGHVAGAEFMFCAGAMGDAARPEDAIEKTAKTKAQLLAALKESQTYCAKAYGMTDVAASKSVQMFGAPMTIMQVLMLNTAHDYEHYGNIVTYLRMNGMVPPSSQGQ